MANNQLNKQCQALAAAGLSSQIYYPADANYIAREASYWAANAPLSPLCIVQPRNTAEVQKVVKAIAGSSGNFTVRSGGHGHWRGASDIHNGVTIDLGLFTDVTVDKKTMIASIGPGPNWATVFKTLEAQGAMVAGGRDGGVGIGGFLTGGGNSYYTGMQGFGADNVVNFEVVLADGRVVNANAKTNSDLWKALKGGSGNFGIVTRFDMQAFTAVPLWGGLSAAERKYGDTIITELINFTNNNAKNPEDALIVNFTYNPGMFTEIVVAMVTVDVKGAVAPPAFEQIAKVPTVLADLTTRSMSNIATSYLLAPGSQNVWYSLTFRADRDIVSHIAALHDEMVAKLLTVLPAADFTTQCLFQPIPAYIAQDRSNAKGGNVLGLDAVKDNALLWLITAAVQTEEQLAIITPYISELSAASNAYAKAKGGAVDWVYLNYADGSQNPLASYGAKNVKFMKDVAKKYDPKAIFQNKVTGICVDYGF
ncbi:putative Cytokinin dehydrogenase 1 [Glarea lozoyensis 74030]|uniref:Putative Cytokinin dehydrogenase 1 n=1 Tax=Glarea lozoyensis (strain ATCC 74030 / MF5533) TaxID=1104152 RepID=H0EXF8_GLAL7|nr:putative Cytokinin dehydrogenase 1 [Glarea lozoyensis 74030]